MHWINNSACHRSWHKGTDPCKMTGVSVPTHQLWVLTYNLSCEILSAAVNMKWICRLRREKAIFLLTSKSHKLKSICNTYLTYIICMINLNIGILLSTAVIIFVHFQVQKCIWRYLCSFYLPLVHSYDCVQTHTLWAIIGLGIELKNLIKM